jgi:hypothetical protein
MFYYKSKLFLFLTNYAPHHEDVWHSGGIAPCILNLPLFGGEWSASRPCRFIPGDRAPGTHWIGGWMGPQKWSGLRREEKILELQPGLELQPLGRPARSQLLHRLHCLDSNDLLFVQVLKKLTRTLNTN